MIFWKKTKYFREGCWLDLDQYFFYKYVNKISNGKKGITKSVRKCYTATNINVVKAFSSRFSKIHSFQKKTTLFKFPTIASFIGNRTDIAYHNPNKDSYTFKIELLSE